MWLDEENCKLKQMVAEKVLDIVGLKAVLSKEWSKIPLEASQLRQCSTALL